MEDGKSTWISNPDKHLLNWLSEFHYAYNPEWHKSQLTRSESSASCVATHVYKYESWDNFPSSKELKDEDMEAQSRKLQTLLDPEHETARPMVDNSKISIFNFFIDEVKKIRNSNRRGEHHRNHHTTKALRGEAIASITACVQPLQ